MTTTAPTEAAGSATTPYAQLAGALRGDLIRPGDSGYEEARVVYNAMIDKRPAAIARCRDVADVIAKAEKIDMTDEPWEVVNFLRDYYDEYQIAPAVRILVKEMTKKYGKEKGDQKALYALFPYGPAKQACKIAGLPKPTGCI